MSSESEDEFAAYDNTTTPFRSVAVKLNDVAPLKTKSSTKMNGRGATAAAVAGPSSKPVGGTKRARKRSESPANETGAETEHTHATEGEEEVVAATSRKGRTRRAASRDPEPAATRSAKPSSKSTITSTQQRVNAKGKGKAKAGVGPTRDASPDAMDIDNLEDIREVAEEEESEVQVRQAAASQRSARDRRLEAKEAAWRKQEERSRKQIERLNERLKDRDNQLRELGKQLEDVHTLRVTEAEEQLEQQNAIYESRIHVQEQMIQELTSQLARVDSLTREGKTSTLHFLTREAADEERRGVERQLEKLKEALREKDRVIAERDKLIIAKEENIQILQSDLKAEIERSKSLSLRPPPHAAVRDPPSSAMKPGPASLRKTTAQYAKGDKTGLVVRMYEDMTNFLVLNVKYEEDDESGGEQVVFKCIYTASEGGSGPGRSLNFSLRFYLEPEGEGEAVEKVAYTPHDLDKEPPEFVETLEFLADLFTFRRTQLDAFLGKLKATLGSSGGDDEEEG